MPNPVALDVAFVPRLAPLDQGSVAIAIDVLRASSSIVTLFDRGCRSIGLAESVEAARAAAKRSSGVLLCGEVGGLPPYGFDHGNSPRELALLDFTGKHAVMATTNGTDAIRSSAEAGCVLVGALLNANAAIREALELLRGLRRLVLVCAGRQGRFVLDDAVAAGYLCHILLNEARVRNIRVAQSNAALAAYRLYHAYPNLLAALNESDSGQSLYPLRLGEDVSYCAKTSISKTVPRLERSVAHEWSERQGLYLL